MIRIEGWPRTLTWSDFTVISARPPGQTKYATIRCSTDNHDLDIGREGRERFVEGLVIGIILVSADCWVVRGQQSPALLNHEQGHLNLFGAGARVLKSRIEALRETSLSRLSRSLNETLRDYDCDIDGLDRQYDNETENGTNSAAQARWDAHIRAAMEGRASLF